MIGEYDQKEHLFVSCQLKIENLITELLEDKGVQIHQIISRTKTRDRLKEKIERKGEKYKTIDDITDIVGIRIISYFADDVDKIAKTIEKEFKIDKPNSIDKRKLEDDRFGYMSLHYVCEFTPDRIKLPEYQKFKGIKFEIQIRSILQHSWAEIEHDIGYKGSYSIPKFAKRSFHRIAALLETADLEFNRLRESLVGYEKEIKKKAAKPTIKVLLDKATISEFIKQNEILKEIENNIVNRLGWRLGDTFSYKDDTINNRLKDLEILDIKNLKELEEQLIKNKEKIISFYYDNNKEKKGDSSRGLVQGASISILKDINS